MTAPHTAGVTIAELPPTTRVSLRLADPAASGLPLPTTIGARSIEGERSFLCLGPDEWLVETPETDHDALLARLKAIAAPHSAVEVSDREITYQLSGPATLDLLAAGCPRDLALMPMGTGGRTVFDSAQVIMTREAVDRFHLTVWRSFSSHVRAILDIAARELATGL